VLKAERRDVLERLVRPEWYFDLKGKVGRGQEGWIRGSVLYLKQEKGGGEEGALQVWHPDYVRLVPVSNLEFIALQSEYFPGWCLVRHARYKC